MRGRVSTWVGWWVAIGGLAMAFAASPTLGQCPADICDCLGEAGQFDIVTDELAAKSGKVSGGGESYRIGALVGASVCATVGKLAGRLEGEAEIGENLILAAPSGVAVTFKGYQEYGVPSPGVFIEGDLLSGGGSIAGAEYGLVAGTTDTTGTAPEVDECEQAQSDAASASAALAALPATQTIPGLTVENQMTANIDAGPGVNVIAIGDLVLKPQKITGYAYGSYLSINLDPLTTSVIINISGKLAVGSYCEITIDGGDVEDVIINVTGAKPTVKIKTGAYIAPAVLAPGRKLLVGSVAFTANLYGKKTTLKGTEVSETLLCP